MAGAFERSKSFRSSVVGDGVFNVGIQGSSKLHSHRITHSRAPISFLSTWYCTYCMYTCETTTLDFG